MLIYNELNKIVVMVGDRFDNMKIVDGRSRASRLLLGKSRYTNSL